MRKTNTSAVARIDNQFVYYARYQLTAREAKVVLYLISKIDPVRQTNLIEQTIPVKELERILKGDGKKWGGIYNELVGLSSRLVKKGIEFPTDIELEGKVLPGYINWFQQIVPIKDEDGKVAMQFLFSQPLQSFLLNLQQYVAVNLVEVINLKSAFSIRMYQVFRAHRNRMAAHQKKSVLQYELEELKALLGVKDKYSDYRNFRLKVLEILKKEINKHTTIGMSYKPLKEGRSVVGTRFEIWDKGKRAIEQKAKEALDFNEISYAQKKAFDLLVSYSINDSVALEMISQVKGSEFVGFEDWYFDEVIKIFETRTKQEVEGAKAGTLVLWFLKMKVFEQDNHFAKIMESIQKRKKILQVKRPEIWDNRMLAKGIAWKAFQDQVKK